MLRQCVARGVRAVLANQAQLPASLGGAATHELSGQGCFGVEPAVSLPRCNDTALPIEAISSHDQVLRRLPPRPTGRLDIWRTCASATMAAVSSRPTVFFASVASQGTNAAEDTARKASRSANANAESAAAPKPKTTRAQNARDNAKAMEEAIAEKLEAQVKIRVEEALAGAAKAKAKAVAEVRAKAKEKLKAALEKVKTDAAEKAARAEAKSKAKLKRAPTAQNLYVREQFKVNPRSSLTEACQRFKELPEFEKQKYIDQAAIGQAEVQRERKRLAAERAARRAMPAYMFFWAEQRPAVVAANPGITMKDASKRVGEMWRGLSVEQRQKYEDMMDADRKAKGLVRRTPRPVAAATAQPAAQSQQS